MPSPIRSITVVVYGTPAAQGSKDARAIYAGKGVNRKFTGKIAQVEHSKKVKPWRTDVKTATEDELPENWQPWDVPLALSAHFSMHKPVSAPKRRRIWPKSKPDLDKLLRSTMDALTDAGLWRDDSRVTEIHASKKYAGDPGALPRPGVMLCIAPLAEYTIEIEHELLEVSRHVDAPMPRK